MAYPILLQRRGDCSSPGYAALHSQPVHNFRS
jgi:hypothetical protein